MDTLISVTSKWQVHLPAEARLALGLTSSKTKLRLKTHNQQIILEPVPSVTELAGSLKHLHKSGKPIDFRTLREAFEKSAGQP